MYVDSTGAPSAPDAAPEPGLRTPPHHRNTTCVTHYRCRLPECVARYNELERDRRALQKQGAYRRFTPAAPVRVHVLQLIAAGASPRGIAAQARVSDKAVRDLLPVRPDGTRTPLRHRMHTDTAAKVLAVTAEDVIAQFVPGLGTMRRLQAAVADGWPMRTVAPHVGLYPSYVSALLNRVVQEDACVLGATALAVARGYDELRRKKPGRHGASRRGIAFAKAYAKDRNWPTTSYWAQFPGALDDPHFAPDYGKLRPQIIAEDAAWLINTGALDRHRAAERLGVDRSYIDRALVEYPEYALGVAS